MKEEDRILFPVYLHLMIVTPLGTIIFKLQQQDYLHTIYC